MCVPAGSSYTPAIIAPAPMPSQSAPPWIICCAPAALKPTVSSRPVRASSVTVVLRDTVTAFATMVSLSCTDPEAGVSTAEPTMYRPAASRTVWLPAATMLLAPWRTTGSVATRRPNRSIATIRTV